jgi:hypothetical protein
MTSNIDTAVLFEIVDPKTVRCMRDVSVYLCLIPAPNFASQAPVIRTYVIITEQKLKYFTWLPNCRCTKKIGHYLLNVNLMDKKFQVHASDTF